MAVHGAIDPAGQPAVVKGGVFRRLGRTMALAAAALATALLMSPTASAQLYTGTSSTGNWANSTPSGTAGGLRWSTNSAGPYGSVYTSGSNTSFNTAGTYTFAKLVASGSATLGDITTAANANIVFTDSASQVLNFGGAGGAVRTLSFGAGSVVDFGSITTVAGNGITKNGAGTLMLTGGAYTGGFTLGTSGSVAGNVIARGANALGTGNIVINGGAIGATQSTGLVARASGKTITVAGDFQLGTSETFNGAATDGFNISLSAANNGLNLNNGARTITLGSSGSMTFGQAITNGSLTLNRLSGASAGQFGLSAANTMSALTLDSVKVNASGQNTVLGTGTVTLTGANATTLNINALLTVANNFTIADSAGIKTIANPVGGSATISGTITNNDSTAGDFVIGAGNGRTLTIGAIGGSGGVTFGGGTLIGTVAMNGAGTYAGNTVIDGSILRMGANGSVAPTNVVFQQTGGSAVTPVFDLNGTTQTVAGLNDSGTAGIIRSTLSGGRLRVGDANDSTFKGTIISGTSLALEKVGSGKLTLTGANTYTNGTTISAGELEVSSQSLRGDVVNNARLTFNQAGGDGTFSGDISGSGSFVKSGTDRLTLTGANSYAGGTTVTAGSLVGTTSSLQGAIANNAAVTFDQSTAGDYAGVMSGNGSLTKLGSGAVTLTGANTYSGATTVSAGTLLVNGSLANSAVTVGNGGTLGGSGSLGALLTVQSGGVLSPGNSPGILAAAALDLEAGSTTFMEVIGNGANAGVAGTGYDQIQITTSGGLTYGGGLNLNFGNSLKFLNGTTFDLFVFSGTPIGNFSAVTSTGTGLYAGFNFSGSGGIWTSTIGDQLLTLSELTGRLTFSSSGGAVPEIDPATGGSALSLVAGVLAMLEQRRRRRSY